MVTLKAEDKKKLFWQFSELYHITYQDKGHGPTIDNNYNSSEVQF